MKCIIRKFISADTVLEAIRMDRKTPVHDCYLDDGEPFKADHLESAIGFSASSDDEDVPFELRKRRRDRSR